MLVFIAAAMCLVLPLFRLLVALEHYRVSELHRQWDLTANCHEFAFLFAELHHRPDIADKMIHSTFHRSTGSGTVQLAVTGRLPVAAGI